MKQLKKIIALVFCLAAMSAAAFAAENGDITVLYNGVELEFTDVKPVIIDGRTMLPFRGVFEQMGAVVDYDNDTRTAKANFNGNEISFSIDGKEIYSAGSAEPIYIMDVPPVIEEGRTLVPVRAVAEAGGLVVGWDNGERTVIVIDKAAVRREIEAAVPELEKYSALFENPATVYTQTETAKIEIDDIIIDVKSEITSDGENRRIVCDLNLNMDSLSDEYKLILANAKPNAVLDIIVTEDALYFKTDLMENLATFDVGGDTVFGTLAKHLSSDKWFRADLSELETFISGADNGVLREAVGEATDAVLAELYLDSLAETVVNASNPDSAEDVRELFTTVLDSCKESASNFLKLTDNADGTVTAEMTIPAAVENGDAVNTYKATYSNGIAIYSELSYIENGAAVETSTTGRVGGMVEKIILPEETTNFVDVLYTIMNLTE
ncbi:MAG: copper amine oxidase N-terminal domain-containing protein [Clostridia bacterium]